jgi:hypothetical protein
MIDSTMVTILEMRNGIPVKIEVFGRKYELNSVPVEQITMKLEEAK